MSAMIGRLNKSAADPMGVLSMAQRLCFGERVVIEAMTEAGLGPGPIAQRLGSHRSTVQRELASSGGRCGIEPMLPIGRRVRGRGARSRQARRTS